jgi:hypothetical protein
MFRYHLYGLQLQRVNPQRTGNNIVSDLITESHCVRLYVHKKLSTISPSKPWPPSKKFPHQNPAFTPSLLNSRYATCSVHRRFLQFTDEATQTPFLVLQKSRFRRDGVKRKNKRIHNTDHETSCIQATGEPGHEWEENTELVFKQTASKSNRAEQSDGD